MSDEITANSPRRYTKRRRAELEDATRRRITRATVELHELVGPARTTVSAIAARAGVQRATVYRHFPDDASLMAACSAHWGAAHPLPDVAGWAAIDDPATRLRTALAELYAWFGRAEPMLEQITRDAALVEPLRQAMAPLEEWLRAAADVLAEGVAGDPATVRAAAGHAVAFETWRSLVRREGLAPGEAVELVARLTDGATRARAPGPRSPRAARPARSRSR